MFTSLQIKKMEPCIQAGGFSAKYNVDRLVYFEIYEDINEAILGETRIKGWKRAWKLELIEKENPDWYDLYEKL